MIESISCKSCDRWKYTKKERFIHWCKSINSKSKYCKELLKISDNDTDFLYFNYFKELRDCNNIAHITINGPCVSKSNTFFLRLPGDPNEMILEDLIPILEKHIGKRCLVHDYVNYAKYSYINFNFNGRLINKDYYHLPLRDFIRNNEIPRFNIYY